MVADTGGDLVLLAASLSQAAMRGADRQREYIARHREALATILIHLQRLGLIGHGASLHPAPPETCDGCGLDLSRRQFFVDGQRTDEMWANLWPLCFFEDGAGIGWGVGQLYSKRGDGAWLLLAGGDPDSAKED